MSNIKRRSLKSKIIIPVVAIVALLVISITVFVSLSVTDLSGRLTDERTAVASHAAMSKLESFEERSRIVALAVSGNSAVASNVINWNAGENREQVRQNLITYLNSAAAETGADSFVIRDAEGAVILRLHDPENYGDADGSPSGLAALEGRTTTSYSSADAESLELSSTAPILHDGQIIGTVTPLFFFHTERFVDSFAAAFNAEITIFAGKTRAATTLRDASGQRVVGTDASNAIVEIVLKGGNQHTTELELVGKPYVAFYAPLNNSAGTPVGMFFIGFSNEYATGATNTLLVSMIIIGVMGLALAILIVLLIVNKIIRPIAVLSAFMNKAGTSGNVIPAPREKSELERNYSINDEIGQLTKDCGAFVEHVDNISKSLDTIANGDLSQEIRLVSNEDTMGKALKTMTENFNNMFSEMNVVSSQVTQGSSQISHGAQALASGSTQQAATVQQLSASIEDIAEKTRKNAERTEAAAQLAATIMKNAEKGSSQMEQMINAVNEINQANQNISKVIKAIDDIAFQTNILALNAAVEAARAGSAGKGFAVVAEEVRNLAAKSAESAKETSTLISNSTEKAQLGTKIANETAASLSEIVSGIEESEKIIAEIAQSSDEQNIAINQINTGVSGVTQVVQQNSATAEESAAASEEMNGQAKSLEGLIARFKLK
jgi:methyl-accepting chemotaxis protein